jgi:hypothetical protein
LTPQQYVEYYGNLRDGENLFTIEMLGGNPPDFQYYADPLLYTFYSDPFDYKREFYNDRAPLLYEEAVKKYYDKGRLINPILKIVGDLTIDDFLDQRSYWVKLVDNQLTQKGQRQGVISQLLVRMGYVLKNYVKNPFAIIGYNDISFKLRYGEDVANKLNVWFKTETSGKDTCNWRVARIKSKSEKKNYAKNSYVDGYHSKESIIEIDNQKFKVGYHIYE